MNQPEEHVKSLETALENAELDRVRASAMWIAYHFRFNDLKKRVQEVIDSAQPTAWNNNGRVLIFEDKLSLLLEEINKPEPPLPTLEQAKQLIELEKKHE